MKISVKGNCYRCKAEFSKHWNENSLPYVPYIHVCDECDSPQIVNLPFPSAKIYSFEWETEKEKER